MRRFLIAPAYVIGLMACTVGPWMLAPYTGKGPPGTYVAAVPVDPSLDLPKDESRLPVQRVATVSYRLDPPVQKASTHHAHERVTLPWSCETIRQATARLTREQIVRLAGVYRLTDQQKAEARRCLKERT